MDFAVLADQEKLKESEKKDKCDDTHLAPTYVTSSSNHVTSLRPVIN